jgi:hypothetical protein
MIRATSPLYVSRADEQAYAPPYRQAGCSLYAFPIPAGRAKLQRIVDRFLADPTDGRVQPRVDADHVLLYFCDFAQSQSHDSVDARRGWLGERECGVWIPLRVTGSTVPAFFAYAMFVDSGPAMCSGREVLGFPKEIGLLHVPRDPADASGPVAHRPGDRRGTLATGQLAAARRARAPRGPVRIRTHRDGEALGGAPRRRHLDGRLAPPCRARAPGARSSGARTGRLLQPQAIPGLRRAAARLLPGRHSRARRARRGASRRVGGRLRVPHPPLPRSSARRRARPVVLGLRERPLPRPRPRLRARRGAVSGAPRRKIAVLGGGVGAMSAVWALTEAPDWHERLEITVYQLGWRLGGKGASGRDAARGQRIEEHGLHIWLGWYDNAFALLRKCYAELGRPADAPLARLEDAFVAHDFVGVAHDATSHWRSFWMVDFPRTARRVGEGEPTRLHEQLIVALKLVARHLATSQLRPIRPETPRDDGRAAYARPTLVTGAVLRLLRAGDHAAARPARRRRSRARDRARRDGAAARVAAPAPGRRRRRDERARGRAPRAAHAPRLRRGDAARPGPRSGAAVRARRARRVGPARVAGPPRRAPRDARAPFIKAWYDLAFAYEDGDTTRPNFAAGAALRAILRTGFTYKGAVFWKMQAGMGDVVFAPLYEVLRRRGVRFEFFHRVDELAVEPVAPSQTSLDRHRVSRVRLTIQATPRDGTTRPSSTSAGCRAGRARRCTTSSSRASGSRARASNSSARGARGPASARRCWSAAATSTT